ncbi:MAG: putative membrane protein YccC [Rhodothermales bacterium]|jgi:uncharacterized membrane protein YccC
MNMELDELIPLEAPAEALAEVQRLDRRDAFRIGLRQTGVLIPISLWLVWLFRQLGYEGHLIGLFFVCGIIPAIVRGPWDSGGSKEWALWH